MQLRRVAALGVAAILAMPQALVAQHRFQLSGGVFHESRRPLESTIGTLNAGVDAVLRDELRLQLGYDLDVVSAASIAAVDAVDGVDAVSQATQLTDERHAGRVGLTGRVDDVRLGLGYRYGSERDYRAHVVSGHATLALAHGATELGIAASASFDSVCTALQLDADPQNAVRLGSSRGCFTSERGTEGFEAYTTELRWTQAVRADLVTSVSAQLQVGRGFQSSPYRAVWIGSFAIPEIHPRSRLRTTVGAEVRYRQPELRTTFGLKLSGYADDWGVTAASGEGSVEFEPISRLRLRGRFGSYTQSAAAFFSDDYATHPRGQYLTGDRELAAHASLSVGLRTSLDLGEAMSSWISAV